MTDIVKIRNEYIGNKKNPHQISTEMGISWATANSYINKTQDEIQHPQKRPNRKSKLRTPELIKAIQDHLRNEIDLKIHKKQKITAVALFNSLSGKQRRQ